MNQALVIILYFDCNLTPTSANLTPKMIQSHSCSSHYLGSYIEGLIVFIAFFRGFVPNTEGLGVKPQKNAMKSFEQLARKVNPCWPPLACNNYWLNPAQPIAS